MALLEQLREDVSAIFRESWSERDGRVVPETEMLTFANDAVRLDATVLYADLSGSTKLVDRYTAQFAAEMYKAYLHCSAKILRAHGGDITAYDGDRIMAVFVGGSKNTSAVRAALKINYARIHIINSAIERHYPSVSYRIKATVGIDTGNLLVAKTGIRGSNDLVWVGRPANYAAKLTELSPSHPTRVTAAVYERMNDSMKTSADARAMWEARTWTDMNGMRIYRSRWWKR